MNNGTSSPRGKNKDVRGYILKKELVIGNGFGERGARAE